MFLTLILVAGILFLVGILISIASVVKFTSQDKEAFGIEIRRSRFMKLAALGSFLTTTSLVTFVLTVVLKVFKYI